MADTIYSARTHSATTRTRFTNSDRSGAEKRKCHRSSIESTSSVLLRNTWEDQFFSMLMLGEHENASAAAAAAAAAAAQQQGASVADLMNPTPMANGSAFGNAAAALVSQNSSIGQNHVDGTNSVSSQDLA